MKKNTVAFLSSYPVQPNIDAFLHNIGRMLDNKFSLDLIMGYEDVPSHLDSLFNIHKVHPPYWDDSGVGYALKATNKYLKDNSPAILLNAAQPLPLGLAVTLVGNWYGVTTLLRVTGHFLSESSMYDKMLVRLKKYLTHNVMLPKVYQRADYIVAIGPRLAQDLVHAGFPEAKVRSLYQPFDARTFSLVGEEEKDELKRQLGLDANRKTILFVGRITWQKGADRLKDVVDQVLARSDRFQFCLVGEGPLRSTFVEYGDDVCLPGFVPHEKVHEYFQAADLLVHPSRSEGAIPHVVLEALASGIPVVAAPVGEIDTVLTTTSADTDDYVAYILSENWTKDPLPGDFEWDTQARAYTELLADAAS